VSPLALFTGKNLLQTNTNLANLLAVSPHLLIIARMLTKCAKLWTGYGNVDRAKLLDEVEQDLMDLICDIAFGQDPATGVLGLVLTVDERAPGAFGVNPRWHIMEGASLTLA
jgi:hypothetical protein